MKPRTLWALTITFNHPSERLRIRMPVQPESSSEGESHVDNLRATHPDAASVVRCPNCSRLFNPGEPNDAAAPLEWMFVEVFSRKDGFVSWRETKPSKDGTWASGERIGSTKEELPGILPDALPFFAILVKTGSTWAFDLGD